MEGGNELMKSYADRYCFVRRKDMGELMLDFWWYVRILVYADGMKSHKACSYTV